MRRAFAVLLVPALLLLGSMTAFAGDGSLPYKSVTEPPGVSQDSAPVIQIEDHGPFGFKSEIRLQVGKSLASQPVESVDRVGVSPYSIQDSGHNHVHQ